VRYDDEQDDNGNDDDDDDKVARGIRLGTHRVAGSQQRSQAAATLRLGTGYRIRFALDSFVLDVFVLLPPSLSGHNVLSLGHFSSTLDAMMHA